MESPNYISTKQAKIILEKLGLFLSERQIKRAAETGPNGKRKLPFFIDPIDGRLKIEQNALLQIYRQLQIEAERSALHKPTTPRA
jgi:hypothetical protein